ncbi:MAG: TetR/AcrR family transcriptional regulator [Rhodocyclaceae bacterium]|nr:TetR/AcrR family transcriptional regulator [Rhodocyclaceae bacterium]
MMTRNTRIMARDSTVKKDKMDREAWIQAATEVLGEEGISGVRVEVLAKRFSVTKGSFYWHFKDRQDLLSAMLETWREGRIKDILKQTESSPGQEAERTKHVIEVYSAAKNRKGMQIELAMRDWARRDAACAAVVEEVDRIRLECAGKLFLASGCSEQEAATRSLLLYAYVFGQSLMSGTPPAVDLAACKTRIKDIISGRSLTTPPGL